MRLSAVRTKRRPAGAAVSVLTNELRGGERTLLHRGVLDSRGFSIQHENLKFTSESLQCDVLEAGSRFISEACEDHQRCAATGPHLVLEAVGEEGHVQLQTLALAAQVVAVLRRQFSGQQVRADAERPEVAERLAAHREADPGLRAGGGERRRS